MNEEVKKTEFVEEETIGASARMELEALLNELIPEDKRTGDVEQMALDWIKQQVEMNNRMVEKISEDPRLAQVFADVVAGRRKPGVALARHFGKNILTAEEGTPEYEELITADEEYFNEMENAKRGKEEMDLKIVEWFEALEDYLEKNGLDKEKYLSEIEDKVVLPALDLVVNDKVFARLVKAVDYDKDVEDAFSAGEVKGRNTNINEMRGKMGDGMPKGLSSVATPVEKPKVRRNSLIESALKA